MRSEDGMKLNKDFYLIGNKADKLFGNVVDAIIITMFGAIILIVLLKHGVIIDEYFLVAVLLGSIVGLVLITFLYLLLAMTIELYRRWQLRKNQ